MKKILMIEDDSLLAGLLLKALRDEGYEVISCKEGQKGFEAASKESPDLILLDHILPGMSGPEIVSALQSDVKLKQIPVVMLSNVGNQDEISRLLKLGIKKYLVKYQLSLHEITESIRQLLHA